MSFENEAREKYGEAKAKFYANPRFAGLVGLVVGVVGTLVIQAIF